MIDGDVVASIRIKLNAPAMLIAVEDIICNQITTAVMDVKSMIVSLIKGRTTAPAFSGCISADIVDLILLNGDVAVREKDPVSSNAGGSTIPSDIMDIVALDRKIRSAVIIGYTKAREISDLKTLNNDVAGSN